MILSKEGIQKLLLFKNIIIININIIIIIFIYVMYIYIFPAFFHAGNCKCMHEKVHQDKAANMEAPCNPG